MKHLFLIFLATITGFLTFSQTNDSIIVLQSPSGRLSRLIDVQDLVNEGNNYWEDKFKGHWAGIELGVNGFSNPDYSMYSAEEKDFLDNDILRSNMLNLNLIQYSKGLQSTRNTIGLVTGLGLSLQSYRLGNNTSIELDDNGKVQPVNLYSESNQKSKLSVIYLEVPLMVEFQIPLKHLDDRLYFSAGINAGKRLLSHTKVKYRINNKKEKLKSPGEYAIRDYKLAASVRFGYRWANLFASYDFTPFFEDRHGPVLYPFSVGVKLISF